MNKPVHADPSVGSCNDNWRADMHRGGDGWREGSGHHRPRWPVDHDRMDHAPTGHEQAGKHWDVYPKGHSLHLDVPEPSNDQGNDADGHARADATSDSGCLAVLISGFAAASGDLTLATGLVQSAAQDRAGVSIAWGEAVFDAYGYGQDPAGTFAAADTWLQVTGADLLLLADFENSSSDADAGQAWAHSQIDYMAIDIHGWSPQRATVIELERAFGVQSPAAGLDPSSDGSLNFAAVAASMQAESANTLALTSIQSFTDSQFSFVYAMALASL